MSISTSKISFFFLCDVNATIEKSMQQHKNKPMPSPAMLNIEKSGD